MRLDDESVMEKFVSTINKEKQEKWVYPFGFPPILGLRKTDKTVKALEASTDNVEYLSFCRLFHLSPDSGF